MRTQQVSNVGSKGNHTGGDSKSTPLPSILTHPVIRLQRTIGNQAVQSLIARESDGTQTRQGYDGEFARTASIREIVNGGLQSPGHPLDSSTRQFMEERFGYDLSQVRVHTDTAAAESSHAIAANAYTLGQHIVFAHGKYSPGSTDGQRLLAHELAHVGQQGSGPVAGTPTADGSLSISNPEDTFEKEADAQADRVIGDSTGEAMQSAAETVHTASPSQGASSPGTSVQREGAKDIKDTYDLIKEVGTDVWGAAKAGWGVGKTMEKMADSNATKTGYWGVDPNTGQPRSAMDWGASLGTDYDKEHNQGSPSITGGLLAAGGGIVGGIGGAVQDIFEGNDVMK